MLLVAMLLYAMLCYATPCYGKPSYAHVRRALALQGAPWCYTNPAWTLNGDYLIQWGGRWGPFMKSQPHRWALLRPKSAQSPIQREACLHEELGDRQ